MSVPVAEGFGEGFEQACQALGIEVGVRLAAQGVAEAADVEDLPPLILVGVRRGLAQLRHQGRFQAREFVEPVARGRVAVEGDADLGLVGEQSPFVEFAQHGPEPARVQPGGQHEIVGRAAFIVSGLDQFAQDGFIGRDLGLGAEPLAQYRHRLIEGRDPQTAGKDAGVVLLPLQQARFLQPGDGDADLGVGLPVVGFEAV